MSIFEHARLIPVGPVLGLTETFKADECVSKVNLGIGVYLDKNGQLSLTEYVHAAEGWLAAATKPYAYLPIDGLSGYVRLVRELVFSADPPVVTQDRIATVQSLGGTGVLRVGTDFIAILSPGAPVPVSDPSWENHRVVFTRAGFTVGVYHYYDAGARTIGFEDMIAGLGATQPGIIVVLHACYHSLTGYNLNPEQWSRVIRVITGHEMIPFLDMAHQGFRAGMAEDRTIISRFAETGLPVFVSTSFSKSLGFYDERVGTLCIVCRDAREATHVPPQVKTCIRTSYSDPSARDVAAATEVLGDPTQRTSWEQGLGRMHDRTKRMRIHLVEVLRSEDVGNMDFIVQQVDMFSYSGLTRDQMLALHRDHSIYGAEKGRICVAAFNDGNLETAAKTIAVARDR